MSTTMGMPGFIDKSFVDESIIRAALAIYPRMSYESKLPEERSLEEIIQFTNRYLGPPVIFTLDSRRYPAPATQDPLTIFTPMINLCSLPAPRWVRLDTTGGNKHEILIFTDGSAPDNGLPNVRAGCGITFRPDGRGEYSFPLERVGSEPLTSNRAELRAAHAALCLRHWHAEGFGKVVIATDSEYLVHGINEWVIRWTENGWKNTRGRRVKNIDLWQMLLNKIEELEASGLVVQFYLIQRGFNLADEVAKKGAEATDIPTEWVTQAAVAV
ncbi:ribonuclease H-like protein [Pholiota conissans]|uniref:ribonuclease H n=1 Tax=Pholiota conissans TaxID=109636 RepID=A0A9P5Z5V9_9AGAR|nr:ribonuclease H-like protein [Pholiota conissans]